MRSGIGILGLAFIVFLTLKLAGIDPVASWSWWWVTAPLWWWIPIAIVVFAAYVLVKAMQGARHY